MTLACQDRGLGFGRGSHELSVNSKLEKRAREEKREVGNPEVPDRVESDNPK